MSIDRRDFLALGTVMAAGTVFGPVGAALSHSAGGHTPKTEPGTGAGVDDKPADSGVDDQSRIKDYKASDKHSWGMVIDVNKCDTGCTACVDACRVENNIPDFNDPELDIHWIRKLNFRQKGVEGAKVRSMPAMCFHCEHPPCAHVCPVAATFVRKDGIVLVDKHRCIGCRYCMIACPYKARSFVSKHVEPKPGDNPDVPVRMHGVVEKCTLCVHRIDSGLLPSCVVACSKEGNGAMVFGDFGDPNSEISKLVRTSKASQIRPDLGCNPRIFYLGV